MKKTKPDTINPNKEDIESFKKDIQYVYSAQDSLLKKLFGFVPEHPENYSVGRNIYTKAMLEVKKEFHIEEGDPRLVLFILEQFSRSPKITDSFKTSK